MKRFTVLAFVLLTVTGESLAHDPQVPSSIEHFPLDQVTKRIHVVHGALALPDPKNRGFMNNPAAILTRNGVIIVDPGSSAEIGKELLKKMRKVSDKPVIAVFNTHVHGDHWLGNHGIREVYPNVPIYAHERMIERVNAGEGDDWIRIFMRITNSTIAGTKVVGPNIGLKGGETLHLDGVTLRVHHAGHAHTDHDLMIEVVDDKGLFFGDIVVATHVPGSDVPQDANFRGTIAAIETMLKGPATVFIPGHGRSGGRDVPESSLRFLRKLEALVTKYYKQGLADYEMKDQILEEMAEYRDWHNFSEMGRVITFVFKEVERDNF